jgi:type I restriction enzyme S subunit
MSAPIVTLGEYVDVASGPAFKSGRFTENRDDIPLVKGENVSQGFILWEKSKYWPADDAPAYERFRLAAGDIVLAMDRPWVTAGLKWARLTPSDPSCLLVQRVARLRAKEGLRQDFLAHIVGSGVFSEYVRNAMGGTNVPHISPGQIKSFRFRLLPEREQVAIAATLGAYDDLIENNRKRIALLEKAARLLYREWFVHLRFPGHEHVMVADGVPAGWSRQSLGSVLTLKRGYDLPAGSRAPGIVSVVSSSGITGHHTQSKAPGPGVVTGRYGTLGEVYLIDDDFWPLNTALYVSDFKGHDPLFVFHVLKTMLKGIGTQKAAIPGVDRNVLHTMPVIWPPRSLRDAFVDAVADGHRQLRVLSAMNDRLGQARDLLLPRLMSGELAV